jgi:hypothetical protein
MTTTDRIDRPARWVDDAIAAMDPETQYEDILKLVMNYKLDFVPMNLVVLVATAGATMDADGAKTLVGTGKMLHRSEKRFADGNSYFFAWLFDGISSDRAKAATDKLNRYHAAIAKDHPAAFGRSADYVYTLAALAVFGVRMRRAVGLPPQHENINIAWHHTLRDLCAQMRGTHGEITGFPEDFDGLMRIAEEWESRPWQTTPEGAELTKGMMQQFCDRFFPRPMHWFARDLVRIVTPPAIRRVQLMGDPGKITGPIVRALFKAQVKKSEAGPDPVVPFSERIHGEEVARETEARNRRMAKAYNREMRKGHLSPAPRRRVAAEAEMS